MRAALAAYQVAGVTTNIEFLHRLVGHHAFATADLDTGLIARNQEALLPAAAINDDLLAIAALAEFVSIETAAQVRARTSSDPYSPWNRIGAWWLNQTSALPFTYLHNESAHPVSVAATDAGFEVAVGKRRIATRVESKGTELIVSLDGHRVRASVVRSGDERVVFCDGATTRLSLTDPWRPPASDDTGVGHLVAPMSGTIIAVHVKAGDRVARGAALLILEAMKMEHAISAPGDGVVEQVFFRAGDQVKEGAELVSLVKPDAAAMP
jgi:3-methylcrotonyl-CoA carboxylase alpha subunit